MPKIKLYCITCDKSETSFEEQAEQACRGGADALQFRASSLTAREIIARGARLLEICRSHEVPLLITGRPDLAFVLDADGVYLGLEDIPVQAARQLIGPRKIVVAAASSLGQATQAAQEGADYVAVGPLYHAPHRPEAEVHGVDIVRMVKKRVKIPVIGIGGITSANAAEVIETGADGVAMERAVCGGRDIEQTVT
jgi:thiamine-phosphate pyrophosphorylase